MKKILIIGGGAMGSAFTIPCLENKNDVTTFFTRWRGDNSGSGYFIKHVIDLI